MVGFNLIGNSTTAAIDVVVTFGNTTSAVAGVSSKVNAVWRWNNVTQKWQFHTPLFDAPDLAAYVAANSYEVLTSIPGGAGFWVQVKTGQAFTLSLPAGTLFDYNFVNFGTLPRMTVPSWSLIALTTQTSAQQFNLDVFNAPTPGAPGTVPASFKALWAWDAVQKNWYFYSPLLERQPGGLQNVADYCTANGYLDFTATGKMLQQGVGFWVQLR